MLHGKVLKPCLAGVCLYIIWHVALTKHAGVYNKEGDMKRKLSSDNLLPTDEHFADDTSTKEDSGTSRLQEINVNANNGEIRETIQILCLVIHK